MRRANELGCPFLPGVSTPTDVELALSLGCTRLKFFPAEALGGARTLAAVAAPYRQLGVRFVPTGGVNPDNIHDYLTLDAVVAVGGTWIAKPDDVAKDCWTEITDRCRVAVAERQ